ncbi:hypothetical protein GCM10027271_17000 [Saccharopolyspora gloriosae]|uniref:Flp pilus assembly protein TadG n=1 Tax=Saccharopolyspora gloriosae TaxID=455344 RepID=A0A840N5I7_9PSEU|nr:hypothetical protein [Saccharopolyspora gloriosae]MBB5067250.1 Flp pilus assembly protein TadG [Saccharopolyspora gloriosae]
MSGAFVAILIVLIVVVGITVSVSAYFRLQRHRADAVAMAAYRKLAEEAVAKQDSLREEIAELSGRIAEVERLLKSID